MKKPGREIPVTVLTGFLGAGKSTLLNRLLRERPNRRFGLIVNEFGEAHLESQLIETRREPIFELPSGCLCCVAPGDLQQALGRLIAKDPRLDHIVIEASGLSSPGPLLAFLTNDELPSNGAQFRLSAVFGVIDSSTFLERDPEYSVIQQQLAFADALFLTKTDLCTPAMISAVSARLRQLRPGISLYSTQQRLPWTILFETPVIDFQEAHQHQPQRRFLEPGHHHEALVLEYQTARPLNLVDLRDVFAQLDPGILRAKGILHLADRSAAQWKYLVQYTGAQKQLYSRPWLTNELRQTALVFIGSDFDAAGLKQRLEACAE